MGRDSAVGMATSCGLDGPGIESRWGGEIFPTRPDWPWGPPCLLYSGFPGIKHSRRGVNHPPPSFAEVKERVSYTAIPAVGLRGLF